MSIKVKIDVKNAQFSRMGNSNNKTDISSFICFRIGEKEYETSVCKRGGMNPSWSHSFTFKVPKGQEIILEAWEYESGDYHIIGDTKIPHNDLTFRSRSRINWYRIFHNDNCAGKIQLVMSNPQANKPEIAADILDNFVNQSKRKQELHKEERGRGQERIQTRETSQTREPSLARDTSLERDLIYGEPYSQGTRTVTEVDKPLPTRLPRSELLDRRPAGSGLLSENVLNSFKSKRDEFKRRKSTLRVHDESIKTDLAFLQRSVSTRVAPTNETNNNNNDSLQEFVSSMSKNKPSRPPQENESAPRFRTMATLPLDKGDSDLVTDRVNYNQPKYFVLPGLDRCYSEATNKTNSTFRQAASILLD